LEKQVRAQTSIFDSEKREIYLLDEIDSKKQVLICGAIETLNHLNAALPIVLVIDSFGGQRDTLSAFVSTIIQSSAPIYAVVTGKAFSLAFDILQFCKKRQAAQNAEFMFHAPAYDVPPGSDYLLTFLDVNVAGRLEFDELHRFVLEIIAHRGQVSIESVRSWSKEEKIFTAAEALELGFIDEVIIDQ
jgi:ATP-dependent protease ClpP protease subunit